ncbi:hypothetical protein [Lentzea sp. NPDC051838]|uniref:hypothetical protein n=1 Tax=Lentzea sp. NPDC051838 TaxID=3154849 RepID=UPI00342210B7
MRNLLIGMVVGAAAVAVTTLGIAPAQAIIDGHPTSVHGTLVQVDTYDQLDDGGVVQIVSR